MKLLKSFVVFLCIIQSNILFSATSVTWPPIGGSSYSIPAAGETGWQSLSSYLIALAGAQGTTNQKWGTRIATTTPVSVSSSTDMVIVSQMAAPGAVTVNLPAAVNGQIFAIIDGTGDAGTNNITIDANAAQTINGSLTLVLSANRSAVVLVARSNAWYIAGSYLNFAAGTIPRSSIAAGTASHVLINDGSGLLSSEAQLNRTRGGTGISSTATFPSSGTVQTESTIATFTNKSIDADTNTITNIEDADIKAAAAIARSKIASGTADHVVINSGAGALSSEAQLASTRGGTGINNAGTLTYGSSNIVITTGGATALTVPTSGTVATLAGSEALTNKNMASSTNTLTGATATSFTGSGASTITLPTSTSTLATLALSESMTNKNLASSTNTLTGATAGSFTNTGTVTLFTSSDTVVGKATTDILTNKTLSSDLVTTALTYNAQAEARFADSDSSNYVGFKGAGTIGANKVWTLPDADGTIGQVLKTDGSLVLGWVSALTNPMTTTGDIIYSSDNSGTAARLGIGAAATYLRSTGTLPAWSTLLAHDVVGVTTNTAATAGHLGEYMEQLRTSTLTLSDDNYADGTASSLDLTAGDWDISAVASYDLNNCTGTAASFYIGIGTASGTSSTGLTEGVNLLINGTPIGTSGDVHSMEIPPFRVLLSGSTSYYLKVRVQGQSTGVGKIRGARISARRMR